MHYLTISYLAQLVNIIRIAIYPIFLSMTSNQFQKKFTNLLSFMNHASHCSSWSLYPAISQSIDCSGTQRPRTTMSCIAGHGDPAKHQMRILR